MNKRVLGFSLAMLAAALAHAEPPGPRAAGIEVRNYPWQAPAGEKSEALELKGNRKRGEEIYELCRSCHLPSAGGLSDGSIPQLAGQHSTVLIKQMADIRAGVRDNPTMYPFAATPDRSAGAGRRRCLHRGAVYSRRTWHTRGKDARQAGGDTGKVLYEKECKACHGASGEGVKEKFYPVIAGQHYRYLLRQMTEIRDGKRRNANPEMVRIIRSTTTINWSPFRPTSPAW
jgi:cytochrome c553